MSVQTIQIAVNAAANITTSISSLALLIHIFGDPDNTIWNNKIKAVLAKLGLTIMICGATSNALILSDPPITELILNVGISLTLFWLSWWQWELFKQTHKEYTKTIKEKSPAKKVTKPTTKKTVRKSKLIKLDNN